MLETVQSTQFHWRINTKNKQVNSPPTNFLTIPFKPQFPLNLPFLTTNPIPTVRNAKKCIKNVIQIYYQMRKQTSTQINPQHNRQRLIQQNIKLNQEIKMLQSKMSGIIEIDITRAIEAEKKKNQVVQKGSQIMAQQAYIKKLKTKIKDMKALNLMEITKGIVAEENQLIAVKKQYDKLAVEKNVMMKKCEQKKAALEYNHPLNSYKNETETELQKIKKKNAEMGAKIVQLQREIRKYHKYEQLHKKYKDEKIKIENPQYQLSKIDHEKFTIAKKSKLIEQKWKPQIDALDRDYFQAKAVLQKKDKEVKELQKELKNWQNRASAVRDSADVLLDRERLVKVGLMSPKKETISKNKTVDKQQNKQSSISQFFKNLFSKPPSGPLTQPIPQFRKWQDNHPSNNQVLDTNQGTQSQPPNADNQKKYAFTKLSQKNEFIKSKNSFSLSNRADLRKEEEVLMQKKKNQIITNSVAIGTSFYYQDDDE